MLIASPLGDVVALPPDNTAGEVRPAVCAFTNYTHVHATCVERIDAWGALSDPPHRCRVVLEFIETALLLVAHNHLTGIAVLDVLGQTRI